MTTSENNVLLVGKACVDSELAYLMVWCTVDGWTWRKCTTAYIK